MEFHFLAKSFMLFENWKHSSCYHVKIWPKLKKAGFSAFFSHGKRKLVMEKSRNSNFE